MEFKEAVNKRFEYFCVWLLAKNPTPIVNFHVTDDYVSKWLKYHSSVIKGEKVKRVTKQNGIGYTTFMALYIYYLANKIEDAQIVIVEKAPFKINKILSFIDVALADITKDRLIDKRDLSKVVFTNGSKVTTLNGTTYSLRNMTNIDLVFFEEFEVANTEKLYFDIDSAYAQSDIKKMILTITNDLDESHPDIEKVELR